MLDAGNRTPVTKNLIRSSIEGIRQLCAISFKLVRRGKSAIGSLSDKSRCVLRKNADPLSSESHYTEKAIPPRTAHPSKILPTLPTQTRRLRISLPLRRWLPVVLPPVFLCVVFTMQSAAAEFFADVKPLLIKYCAECHSGDDANGDVAFDTIETAQQVALQYELWESVAGHLTHRTMPPEDQPRPSDTEKQSMLRWYKQFVDEIEARPAVMRPRRLSVAEYRNTMRSLLGFDLQVDVIEAEQTLTERSMVIKLLPIDPPGKSGFKNDTHGNPLTTVAWDQMSYLVDAAIQELLSKDRRNILQSLVGEPNASSLDLTYDQAKKLLRSISSRAFRRPITSDELAPRLKRIEGLAGRELQRAVRLELKSILMSPRFFYRGLSVQGKRGERQDVDAHEFAERLSYFLWADMPDERLFSLAKDGTIRQPDVMQAEIKRMLVSPKARALSEVFANEWLSISEIKQVSNDVPKMVGLLSQPLDFMNYLFTENRPILELIDSDTAFISPFTAKMYGSDAKQMKRFKKPKGIEVAIVPNQKIQLKVTKQRGGILTMPGILAMNRGPILRGTWVLEKILGQHLPDPPANVGQVKPNGKGEKLTFRQRFEQHRANAACAVCHDKIDPLGFALQAYGTGGQFLKGGKVTLSKKEIKKGVKPVDPKTIDTSGRLPSGESFDDLAGLKEILRTSQREMVVRNVVERTMSYALCRKLQLFDMPTVDLIVDKMVRTDGTWQDLFVAIASSVPFRETVLSQ